MSEFLIPSRRTLSAEDPIFALNAEACRRKASGEPVVNATLGALLDEDGHLVVLTSVLDLWSRLSPSEIAPYAPISGDPAFLEALVQRHWPNAPMGAAFGAACATPGGTGALALSLHNFLEPGMAVLTAAPYWGPYDMLATEHGLHVVTAPFPVSGASLDLEAWRATASGLLRAQGRLLVWLNEPCHNPTGQSLRPEDRSALLSLIGELAQHGPIILLLDCAYLDYTADPGHVRRALDAYGAFAQEGKVLVGASLSLSKSLTLYGARSGALAFPWCNDSSLRAALGASCRGHFSNCNRAAQSLLVRLHRDPTLQARLQEEHRAWSRVLAQRAAVLDEALRGAGGEGVSWKGGFFVTLPTPDPRATARTMQDRGVFAVPVQGGLRVGLCALRTGDAGRVAQAFQEASPA